MKNLVNGMEMRSMDRHSIDTIGIPSIVLMERAAEAVVQTMKGRLEGRPSILIVCGTGNNGADGLAMARMLTMDGYPVEVCVVGNSERRTDEWKLQMNICENLKIYVHYGALTEEYISDHGFKVVVDAMLGTGLSRLVTGEYEEAIRVINNSPVFVTAVDIPSGISADTGVVLGEAVQADLTVTFQCQKLGMALYPGRDHCGEIVVADIGIAPESLEAVSPKAYTMSEEDLMALPLRPAYSNKGTFGKVLIIAGSENMSGAAYLSALAAYRSGAGLVRIYTPESNRIILQTGLPEAILTTYTPGALDLNRLKELCGWADSVVIGPGLGTGEMSRSLVAYMMQYCQAPMVLDADALNIIAANPDLTRGFREGMILTPHLGEMSRLIKTPISHIKLDLPETAIGFVKKYPVVMVLKDACTLVADGSGRLYANTCGNSGMATGGSGDVLSGIIGGLLASGGLNCFEAASYGVLMHGLAGDRAAAELGERAVMAGDIARRIV